MLLQHDFKGQSGAALRSKEKKDRRHITIREVAKAAGASVATISAALNNSDYVSAEMRTRIQDAIKQLKYRPNDLARGLRLSEALEFGMVGLNRGVVSDPAAPFGGVKQSGIGREGAHEGLLEFTETKYIATSW